MATQDPPSTPSPGGTGAPGERLRATLANLGQSLDRNSLLRRLTTHTADVSKLPATSFQGRIRDQWQRIRAELGGTSAINGIDALYRAELHDLHDAEVQACALADEIWVTIRNEPLAQRVSDYASQMRLRTAQLGDLLSSIDGSSRDRPNDVMRALVHEASEMAELCGEEVRDVAMAAAFQRIVHSLSADYRTLAAHAEILGRTDEATLFQQHAQDNRAAQEELIEFAKDALKARAADAPG
jgi:ferritin-like metal-binding protein YciE